MRHQLIPLTALRELGNELEKSYVGINPQRLSFIALLKELNRITEGDNSKKTAKLFLGAVIFELESIRNEYSYFSPEGSDMYRMLQDKMNINAKNPLKEDERLIYLNKFHQECGKRLTDSNIQHLISDSVFTKNNKTAMWTDKNDFVEQVHHTLKKYRKRDADRINFLVHATPELIALQKNTQKLAAGYKEATKSHMSWFKNPRRENMLKFIELVSQTCNEYYGKNKDIERLQQIECETRKGLIIFVLMDIEKEYKFFSPKGGWFNNGSALFKESLRLLAVENLKDLNYSQKIDWLKALSMHIDEMKHDSKHELNKDLIMFQTYVNQYKSEQEIERLRPTATNRVVSIATSYAAESGIRYAIETYGGHAVDATLSIVATVTGGPVGTAIYFGGRLLMTGLGRFVSNGLLTITTATMYAWLLENICGRIGDATANVITYRFSPTPEGFEKLRSLLKPEEDIIFCKWVNTLLALPDDVTALTEKEHIRHVLDIEKDGKLKPLEVKVEPAPKVTFFGQSKIVNEERPKEVEPQAPAVKWMTSN